MKSTNIFKIFILAFGFLSLSPGVYAEVIQAEVTEVDLTTHSLKVLRSDDKKSGPIQILAEKETRFEGLQGLQDLRVGDEVRADLSKKAGENTWLVKSIQLYKVHLLTEAEVKADANS